MTANPITTTRFCPSGSLINKNTALDNARDTRPRISNGIFFDLKYIVGVYHRPLSNPDSIRVN